MSLSPRLVMIGVFLAMIVIALGLLCAIALEVVVTLWAMVRRRK